MGDISEMRGLIVIGSFLFISSFLMAGIFGDFAVTLEGRRQIVVPEYFSGLDLGSFAQKYNGSVPQTSSYDEEWSLGGYDWIIYIEEANTHLVFGLKQYWGPFWIGTDDLHFITDVGTDRGDFVTRAILDGDCEEGKIKYTMYSEFNSRTVCTVYFAFDTSLYDKPSEAWNNGTEEHSDLKFMQGMGLDQISSTYNGWTLIGQILFFQMPNVHPIIQMIISVPIWIAVAYLTFILILRAIGAVFGGGGA